MSTPNADVTTAVIMARGLGSRMKAASPDAELTAEQDTMASRGMKGMINVGRPFLDHVISAAADAGIRRFILVIGPEHDEIRRYYAAQSGGRTTIEFAVQDQPRGTGDAVQSAAETVGNHRFLVLNSDNYYPTEVLRALREAPGCALVGFSPQGLVEHGNIAAERVRAFALLEQSDGLLTSIIEKPDDETLGRLGPDALVSMNCYSFTPAIFGYTAALVPSTRGEYELTDAVRAAIAAGEPFTVVPSDEGVLDLSNRGDIASVATALADHEVLL